MSTKFIGNTKPTEQTVNTPIHINPGKQVIELISVMQSVKTDTPEAKLNKTTISDNNGDRITLNDHMTTSISGSNFESYCLSFSVGYKAIKEMREFPSLSNPVPRIILPCL